LFILGFGIAFHSLFPKTESYESASRVAITLFSASLGGFEFGDFSDQTDSFKFAGNVLLFCFVTMSMLVLVNLVVARMSVRGK
jgi:hypothetical protein